MNSWKIILATMVIFGAGVVTGGLLVRYSGQRTLPRQQPQGTQQRAVQPSSAGGQRIEFLRRATRDLDLTPAQREQVDKILKDSQERTKRIMEPVTPQLREELQRTKEQFREALTPPQRARFDEMVKKQSQRPHEVRRPPGSPPERDAVPQPRPSEGTPAPRETPPRTP